MYDQIKKSHSIHMLSIQINTTRFDHFPLVEQHQIVLLCKPYVMEFSIFRLLDAVQLKEWMK